MWSSVGTAVVGSITSEVIDRARLGAQGGVNAATATRQEARMATPSTPAAFADAMPFARACGVEFVAAAPGEVVARMAWHPDRCTVEGVLHGAALITLADSAGAVCAFLNLPPGAGTSTLNSSTSFFAAVRQGSVRAVSRPLHIGRTTIAVRTELLDDDERLVAHVTQTQAVLAPRTATTR